MRKTEEYSPAMPEATREIAAKWKLRVEKIFELQIDLATQWLMAHIGDESLRFRLYKHPDFWSWFLTEWESVDCMLMMQSELREGGAYVNIEGKGVSLTRPALINHYIGSHTKFYERKPIDDMPRIMELMAA